MRRALLVAVVLLAGCAAETDPGFLTAKQAETVAGPQAAAWDPAAQLLVAITVEFPVPPNMTGPEIPDWAHTLTERPDTQLLDGRAQAWSLAYGSPARPDEVYHIVIGAALEVVRNGPIQVEKSNPSVARAASGGWDDAFMDVASGAIGPIHIDSNQAAAVARENETMVRLADGGSAFFYELVGLDDDEAWWIVLAEGEDQDDLAVIAIDAVSGEEADFQEVYGRLKDLDRRASGSHTGKLSSQQREVSGNFTIDFPFDTLHLAVEMTDPQPGSVLELTLATPDDIEIKEIVGPTPPAEPRYEYRRDSPPAGEWKYTLTWKAGVNEQTIHLAWCAIVGTATPDPGSICAEFHAP